MTRPTRGFPKSGDWFYDAEDDTLTIFISRMEDMRSEMAVAVHELVESVHVWLMELTKPTLTFST